MRLSIVKKKTEIYYYILDSHIWDFQLLRKKPKFITTS